MNRSVFLLVLGVVVVVVAIFLNIYLERTPKEEVGVSEKKTQTTIDKEKAAPPANKNIDQKQALSRPEFDIVRVNPKGEAVLAGRARPGWKVLIFDNDLQIGSVTADNRGEWVFVPKSPLKAGSRNLSLKMQNIDGVELSSDNSVIIIVPETGKDIAGRLTSKPSMPLALKTPANQDKPVEVLQKTGGAEDSGPIISFSVDAIDYDKDGKLSVSGKNKKNSIINLYLDNMFIGRTTANDRGFWSFIPQNSLKPGIYKLRADHVDKSGKVYARREVTFSRSVPLEGIKPGTMVVVEPGNSLWRIARRTYGSGFKYTVIFEANKNQIKNEDLIFPGQVFSLPATK